MLASDGLAGCKRPGTARNPDGIKYTLKTSCISKLVTECHLPRLVAARLSEIIFETPHFFRSALEDLRESPPESFPSGEATNDIDLCRLKMGIAYRDKPDEICVIDDALDAWRRAKEEFASRSTDQQDACDEYVLAGKRRGIHERVQSQLIRIGWSSSEARDTARTIVELAPGDELTKPEIMREKLQIFRPNPSGSAVPPYTQIQALRTETAAA